MSNRILRILAALCLAAATPALSAFHLWRMTELYSSADGTIQFLELADGSNGEQFVGGTTLRATGAFGGSHTFEFPNNLPSSQTAGKRFLIGTESMAALGIITPNYVVPDGFFFRAGGTITFAGVDTWSHGALPTDGKSLMRNGSTAQNDPQNFAGARETLPVSSAQPSFQALWWKSPANSESGWGVNVTQQGNILFVTWFTYDLDGSQMWLVGPNVARTSGDNFTGQLYRTTGPAFSSNPFNPSAVVATPVGTVSLSFSGADTGTFTAVVNNVTVEKPITRQIFRPPFTCQLNGTPGNPIVFQDLWWRAPANSESGWGVNLTHQGDILFATWFTYDASGRGMWLVGPAIQRTAGDTFTGQIYRTTGPAFNASPWNGANVVATPVGTATFAFTDANNGNFSYTLDNVSQTKAITRQVYSTPATVCH